MTRKITRRIALAGFVALPFGLSACGEEGTRESIANADLPWAEILAAADGQTVNWLAWAGDPKINAFIQWTADIVREKFGIRLRHVQISDSSALVQQLLADRAAGRSTGGRSDLVWINGENFIAAKEGGLLWGPFAEQLPNFALVDTVGKPSTVLDFTVPIEGYESPWGMAQLTFFYDRARVEQVPRTVPAFLRWAERNPGRFTYPAPPDFVGTTFLKQVLYELSEDWSVFMRTFEPSRFEADTAPIWRYLDDLHPHLWRGGRTFPPDYPSLRQLMEDNELDIAFAFNPSEAANAVLSGLLPETTQAYILDGGTIQNSHFLAIPFNTDNAAGSMVVANFLLSPEAQARKADPTIWGDPTVLDLGRLGPASGALFSSLPGSDVSPGPDELARGLPEPHPTWHLALQDHWRRRYAS